MAPIPLRSMEAPPPLAPDPVFTPVRSQTAFEETLERLGTAIRLGLLEPGARLPAERDLCAQLGISRSTLRQALTALVQSGHLHAVRGRRGGTFVAEQPAARAAARRTRSSRAGARSATAASPPSSASRCWRAGAPTPEALAPLDELVAVMQERLEDFPAYRHADVRFHVGLAETTGSVTLVSAMTEAQGAMGALIDHIAHPPEVLASSNHQHRELLAAVRAQDVERAARVVTEHLEGTVHVLAGLLPLEGGAAGYN